MKSFTFRSPMGFFHVRSANLFLCLIMVYLMMRIPVWGQEHDPKFFLKRSREQASRKITWEKVKTFDFSNPAEIGDWPMPQGKWEITNGALIAVEGERNRAILLHKSVGDPVRIDFYAVNTADNQGQLGDITVLLNSVDGTNFFGNGYALTTASYWNNCTTFYRKGKPIARTEYTPVESGVMNHVVLEFSGGHIRYWLNGQIILEAWDSDPLPMEPGTWIGIRTWATRMVVDNVIISRGLPQ